MDIDVEIIDLIEEIKNNKTDGASELARQAVKVMKTAAERSQAGNTREFLLEQKEIGKRLISARPTMAPITNIVSRLLSEIIGGVKERNINKLKQVAISGADKLIGDSLEAVRQIAVHGARLVADGDRIITISYSSTVIAMLKKAFSEHKDIEVIATRPGRSGEKTARALGFDGIPVTLIDDAAVGLYISAANKVVVGADRICADSKVVNGIGTYQLALVSEKAEVPFYVLCDTFKFDFKLRSDQVDLEDNEPSEVVETEGLPSEVRVKNTHFDITPLDLVTAVVTENGLLTTRRLLDTWRETMGQSS
ncbi:translation initiation factor eIF-2B [Chloroflexota bacterium]